VAIREMLVAPAELAYRPAAGPTQPAQRALRDARGEIARAVPPGYRVRVSGAAQNLPHVPWLAILDEDVTTTAREGLYVVYLFAEQVDRAYLSMNQGVTAHLDRFSDLRGRAREDAALAELEREASILRTDLGAVISGMETAITLGSTRFLGRGYEAANIAAIRYDVLSLPTESRLRADLDHLLDVYERTVAARDHLLVEQPGLFHTPSGERRERRSRRRPDRPPVFRPKDAGDYIAQVTAREQRRTRKHEALISRFGSHARDRGLTVATNVHPRDLTLRLNGKEVLVEAKTVGPNAELAVRAAIGQLFAYRHLLYRQERKEDPTLLAVFSEPIGDAFVELLNSLGIAAIWLDSGSWRGSGEPAGLID
jgi:MrcB-like, N-terminal domain